MSIDKMTRETIQVDGALYRRAFADAFMKAVNNNPECVPGDVGAPDKAVVYFHSICCEWFYSISLCREWVKRTLGDRSAAYRSIPDLFTKEAS